METLKQADEGFKPTLKENPTESAKTLEELAACRRLRHNEYRRIQKELETPTEATARRLKNAEQKRKRLAKKIAQETPEQAAERLIKQRECLRRYRKMLTENETPEQMTARLLKQKEDMTNFRLVRRANETPEEAAARRLKGREYSKSYRLMKRANKTSEEGSEGRLKQGDQLTRFKEDEETASVPNINRDPKVKYENVDEKWNGSFKFSPFGASEGSSSQTLIEGTLTATRTHQTSMQSNSDAPCEEKSKTSRDNGFSFDIYEIYEIVNSCASSNESISQAVVQDIIVKEEVDL